MKVRTPMENVMSHPADGEAWKYFDSKEKSFASDPRNLRLALTTDGFNPFWQHEYPVQYVASASDSTESPTLGMC
jgi:hypothetical protein